MMMVTLTDEITVLPDFILRVLIDEKKRILDVIPSGYSFLFSKTLSKFNIKINYFFETDEIGDFILKKYLKNCNLIKLDGNLYLEVLLKDQRKIYTNFSLKTDFLKLVEDYKKIFEKSEIIIIYRINYIKNCIEFIKRLNDITKGKIYLSLFDEKKPEKILKFIPLLEKGYIDYLVLSDIEFDHLCSYYGISNINYLESSRGLFENLNIEELNVLNNERFLIYPGNKIVKLKSKIEFYDLVPIFDSLNVLSLIKNFSYENRISFIHSYLIKFKRIESL